MGTTPTPETIARYRRLRAIGVRPVHMRPASPPAPALDWRSDRRGGWRATWETCDGWQLAARVRPDDIPPDMAGSYSDRPAPEAIDRHRSGRGADRRSFRYWHPPETRADLRAWYRSQGYARGPADVAARAAQRAIWQADERLNEEGSYVLDVEARRRGVLLGGASLGGIDVDPGTEADLYNEEAANVAHDALSQARAALASLCACHEDETGNGSTVHA